MCAASKRTSPCVERDAKMEIPTMLKRLLSSLCWTIFLVLFLAGVSAWGARFDPIELYNPQSRDLGWFGISVSGVPDINGDGRWEVVVGCDELKNIEGCGDGRIFDGATGQLLGVCYPSNSGVWSMFGDCVSGVPDVNGDGCGDVVVSACYEHNVFIYDGKTRQILRVLHSPMGTDTGYNFGRVAAGIPDINGDGRGDVIVGSPTEDPGASPYRAGRAYVFNGATGSLLHTLVSPNEEKEGVFGVSVVGVPDVNGDGRTDILVGSQESPTSVTKAGRVYMFDGATGNLLNSFVSPNKEVDGSFGWSLAGMPDVTGDGRGDILVGACFESLGGIGPVGRVYLLNGATGQLLHTFVSPYPVWYGDFGVSVSSLPDVTGDGYADILIGACYEWAGGIEKAGKVYVYDGRSRQLVHVLASPNAQYFGSFGISVAGLPDVNGDGWGDAVIGAYGESVSPKLSYLLQNGRAYIFHLGPKSPASVGMDWTLYGSGALGFGSVGPGVKKALPCW